MSNYTQAEKLQNRDLARRKRPIKPLVVRLQSKKPEEVNLRIYHRLNKQEFEALEIWIGASEDEKSKFKTDLNISKSRSLGTGILCLHCKKPILYKKNDSHIRISEDPSTPDRLCAVCASSQEITDQYI
jgi:hypothetical protein